MRQLSGGLLGVLFSLAALGCGGDGGGGSTAADALTACNSYCDTYAAATCADPIYTSVDDCRRREPTRGAEPQKRPFKTSPGDSPPDWRTIAGARPMITRPSLE